MWCFDNGTWTTHVSALCDQIKQSCISHIDDVPFLGCSADGHTAYTRPLDALDLPAAVAMRDNPDIIRIIRSCYVSYTGMSVTTALHSVKEPVRAIFSASTAWYGKDWMFSTADTEFVRCLDGDCEAQDFDICPLCMQTGQFVNSLHTDGDPIDLLLIDQLCHMDVSDLPSPLIAWVALTDEDLWLVPASHTSPGSAILMSIMQQMSVGLLNGTTTSSAGQQLLCPSVTACCAICMGLEHVFVRRGDLVVLPRHTWFASCGATTPSIKAVRQPVTMTIILAQPDCSANENTQNNSLVGASGEYIFSHGRSTVCDWLDTRVVSTAAANLKRSCEATWDAQTSDVSSVATEEPSNLESEDESDLEVVDNHTQWAKEQQNQQRLAAIVSSISETPICRFVGEDTAKTLLLQTQAGRTNRSDDQPSLAEWILSSLCSRPAPSMLPHGLENNDVPDSDKCAAIQHTICGTAAPRPSHAPLKSRRYVQFMQRYSIVPKVDNTETSDMRVPLPFGCANRRNLIEHTICIHASQHMGPVDTQTIPVSLWHEELLNGPEAKTIRRRCQLQYITGMQAVFDAIREDVATARRYITAANTPAPLPDCKQLNLLGTTQRAVHWLLWAGVQLPSRGDPIELPLSHTPVSHTVGYLHPHAREQTKLSWDTIGPENQGWTQVLCPMGIPVAILAANSAACVSPSVIQSVLQNCNPCFIVHITSVADAPMNPSVRQAFHGGMLCLDQTGATFGAWLPDTSLICAIQNALQSKRGSPLLVVIHYVSYAEHLDLKDVIERLTSALTALLVCVSPMTPIVAHGTIAAGLLTRLVGLECRGSEKHHNLLHSVAWEAFCQQSWVRRRRRHHLNGLVLTVCLPTTWERCLTGRSRGAASRAWHTTHKLFGHSPRMVRLTQPRATECKGAKTVAMRQLAKCMKPMPLSGRLSFSGPSDDVIEYADRGWQQCLRSKLQQLTFMQHELDALKKSVHGSKLVHEWNLQRQAYTREMQLVATNTKLPHIGLLTESDISPGQWLLFGQTIDGTSHRTTPNKLLAKAMRMLS